MCRYCSTTLSKAVGEDPLTPPRPGATVYYVYDAHDNTITFSTVVSVIPYRIFHVIKEKRLERPNSQLAHLRSHVAHWARS